MTAPIIEIREGVITPELLKDIAANVEPGTEVKVTGMFTKAEYEEYLRLKNARRVRIRNDGAMTGELFGCKRHGSPSRIPGIHIAPVIHPFLSSYCVPIPFRGLDDGLNYLLGVSSNATFRDQAGRLLSGLPSLDDVFPEMANKIRPTQSGEDIIAFCIGKAEPISAAQAEKDEDEIARRSRRPLPRR